MRIKSSIWIYAMVAFLIPACFVYGQTTLSMNDCFLIAAKQNIPVQLADNDIQIANIRKSSAKFALLPSLSYDMNHYFSFGKNIDPVTNAFAFEQFSGGEMGLRLRMNLFSGFQNLLAISENMHRQRSAEYAKSAVFLEICFQIVDLFSSYMIVQESTKAVSGNIKILKNELEIITEKIKVGRLTEYEAFAFEARLETEKAEMIRLNNETEIILQQLKELLNFPYDTPIALEELDISELENILYLPTSKDEVISMVVNNHPIIGQFEEQLKVSDMVLKSANRAFYPSLRLGASVLSNYSVNMGQSVTNETLIMEQVFNNLGQYISVGLSIPIFTQMQNLNRVREEKIRLHNTKLNLDDTRNSLVSNTLQLYNTFLANREKYQITLRALEKNKLSYDLQEEKYRLGRISSVELLTARDMFNASLGKFNQAKLSLYFSYQLLMLLEAV
ncbi:TolC family protein [Pararhodonellum marinum]|uniref:TolC family protein n=1 Tax=Pararhodonellum marinum TaxID=2755358 RepID=UPI00188EABBE|nr:TolC family protein [Pararhodonellum marinum]